MRLDAFLAEMKLYASRTRAERAVKEGCVKVNGKVVKKCSFEVTPDDKVECLPDPLRYVSRGALKLEYALKAFGIDVPLVTYWANEIGDQMKAATTKGGSR